jgi:hypothetical protein
LHLNINTALMYTSCFKWTENIIPSHNSWYLIWNQHGHECSRIWKWSGKTHSTNEDLLNIKCKGDPKSYALSRTSDTTETRNLCVISHLFAFLLILIFFNLINLFWHTDKNFCFYAEVNFWDFVKNDSSIDW